MKKSIRKSLGELALRSAKLGADSASFWHLYQPAEPKSLQKLKKR